MPKSPILHRETFFNEVRHGDKTKLLQHLDWNRVQTDLGFMAEPRSIFDPKITQMDMTDAAFSKISVIPGDTLYRELGTGGPCTLIDYNV